MGEWDPLRLMRELMRWDPFRGSGPMPRAEQDLWLPHFRRARERQLDQDRRGRPRRCELREGVLTIVAPLEAGARSRKIQIGGTAPKS